MRGDRELELLNVRRDFERLMSQPDTQFERLIDSHVASGWIARYEVWTTKQPKKKILSVDIPLAQEEVRLQLLQSVNVDERKSRWYIQFPITVSQSISRFTVLGTVYSLSLDSDNQGAKLQSRTLPLECDPAMTGAWKVSSYRTYGNHRQTYAYWTRLTPDGGLLFVMDDNNCAIYRLSESETLEAELQASFTFQFSMRISLTELGDNPIEIALHPEKEILAFTRGHVVFLWSFKPTSGQSLRYVNRKREVH